jgi:hypothetical protein
VAKQISRSNLGEVLSAQRRLNEAETEHLASKRRAKPPERPVVIYCRSYRY